MGLEDVACRDVLSRVEKRFECLVNNADELDGSYEMPDDIDFIDFVSSMG